MGELGADDLTRLREYVFGVPRAAALIVEAGPGAASSALSRASRSQGHLPVPTSVG